MLVPGADPDGSFYDNDLSLGPNPKFPSRGEEVVYSELNVAREHSAGLWGITGSTMNVVT